MINSLATKDLQSPLKFKCKSVIFRSGEFPRTLFIIKSGKVDLVKTHGQRLLLLGVCKEKDILNEVNVIKNIPMEFSAIAKTDVELIAIDQKDILKALKEMPGLISEIFETLCDRLISSSKIIEDHHMIDNQSGSHLVLKKEIEALYSKALLDYIGPFAKG